jgi:3-oxoacyl-[acyl-carrier-protein] synthase II
VHARPYITGAGLVAPLGDNLTLTWDALLAERCINDHHPANGAPLCRLTTLATTAASEAIAVAGWTKEMLASPETALLVGTSKGPVQRWLTTPSDAIYNIRYVDLTQQGGFGIAEVTKEVASNLGLGHGPRLAYSAACASGLHALIQATAMLRSGIIRRAIVVAGEASVHALFIASFKRLGVVPADGIGCRPFDQARDGFLMSDAAAAVCLETEPRHPEDVMIDGTAILSEASHLTAPDPSGRVLRRALNQVINARPVDLIHAHGTGTFLNDPIELAAIESVLDENHQISVPNIYSHKGALGHSLGASGLVATVLSVRMHMEGIIPGNIRTSIPLPTRRSKIDQSAARRPIQRSAVLAAGFGGTVAAISLESRQ